MSDTPTTAHLRTLLRFNQALDHAGLLQYILETALGLARAGAGVALLEEAGKATVAAASGLDRETHGKVAAALDGTGGAGGSGAAVGVKSAAVRVLALLPRRKESGRPGEPPREPAAFPLSSGDRFLGALCLADCRGGALDRAERDALVNFCDQAAVALENFRLLGAAVHDAETGMLAAGYFATRLEEEFSRAQRYRRRLTLVLLDVDRLGLIREISGAPAALRVLAAVVQILRKTLRRVDIVGRIHDSIFALLLPETPPGPAASLARRLVQQVGEGVVEEGSRRVEVAASGAVVSFPGDGRDAHGLSATAQRVLDAARRAGGGKVFTVRDLPSGGGPQAEETDETGVEHLVLSREGRALIGMIARMASRRELEQDALFEHVLAALVEMTRA
ncbi:MAG: GGDEF domain-containing protein, partial [Planctomycetes bacterium]|nr:GGDEF domain-containing protein [Planctomycetota bacterium]